MSKIAIVYFSKYGTTYQYAKEIALPLNADVLDGAKANAGQLVPYDVILWGSALYAGRLTGIKQIRHWIVAQPKKRHYVFLLGMAEAGEEGYYQEATKRNFPPEVARFVRRFYFVQGTIPTERLTFLHRSLLKMVVGAAQKKPQEERTLEERAALASQEAVEFDIEQIKDMVEDVVEENIA